MKQVRWLFVILLGLSILSCARAGTYPVYLRYDAAKELPALQAKLGANLALAPFKDERSDTLYVGVYMPFIGSASDYFKSEPQPLDKALNDSLSQFLSARGVKTVLVSQWDGMPDSLRTIDADSVLQIDIKKVWVDGVGGVFGTKVKTSVNLLIHLGVKKDGKVYSRNIETEKEMTVGRMTPAYVEQTLNQIFTEIFDSYFSNPY
jgi:hypothetical protein